ncbi:MAG: hypothetical protein AB7O71_10725 [Hyphomicrobiaceae bacterium]
MRTIGRAMAAVVLAASSTSVLADSWTTMEEESISLSYGSQDAAKLEIFCDKDSQIVVPEPGRVKPSAPVVFTFVEAGKTKTIQLDTEICGVDGLTCTDRKNGEISAYKKTVRGKKQALAWAEKTSSFSVKGPTINLSMKANNTVFAKFAASCKKWK